MWHCDVAKLNSSYSRIARSSGLTSPAPASRTTSQDTLRRWEKSAREATYVCNQAAGLSRCINKVQQGMTAQLKIIQSEQSKGKSVNKAGTAMEELQYLMNFNSSISQCMAKTMEHFSDFAFVSKYNSLQRCIPGPYKIWNKTGHSGCLASGSAENGEGRGGYLKV